MARAASAAAGSDTRERILAGALEAFSEKGFDGASTREIANRAHVQLGLLQYHFGGKLKLWQAAVDRAFGEMHAGLDAAMADSSVSEELERVRLVIRAHVHFVSRNPQFVRLMHDEGKRRGPRMRWLVDRHVKPMFAILVPGIARWQELGLLPRDIAPVHFVYALIGAIDVMFHQAEECRRVTGLDSGDPQVAESHARAVEYLFLGRERLQVSATLQ